MARARLQLERQRDFTGGLAPERARAFARRPVLRALDTQG